MALRYFNPIEPEYVPTYTPLDPQITSLTNQQIQQQGAKAQQYQRDTFDLVSDNMASAMSNLGGDEALYIKDRINKSKQNISSLVEEQGARNSMPFVDKEVSKLTSDLQYHRKASQLKANAMEILKESPAPSAVQNYIAREGIGIKRDEETGEVTGIRGGYSEEELNIAKNWEDFSDFLNKFSGSRKGDTTETTFGQTNYSETLPNGDVINYREQLTGVSFGDAHIENMGALLSDPKMREQLSLYANSILQEDNPDIRTTESGVIERDFYLRQQDKKTGEYVKPDGTTTANPSEAKIIKETKEFGSKEAMAASVIAEPYSLKDSGLKTKYITNKSIERASGSSGTLGNDPLFTTKQSVLTPEMEATEYLSGLYQQRDRLIATEQETMIDLVRIGQDIFGGNAKTDDLKVSEVDGDIQITYREADAPANEVTTLKGEDEIVNYFTDKQESLDPNSTEFLKIEQNKQSVMQKIGATKEIMNRKRVLSSQLEDAQNATYNRLSSRYDNEIADIVRFNPSGEVDIDLEALKKTDIEGKDLGSNFASNEVIDRVAAKDIGIGEIGEVTIIDATVNGRNRKVSAYRNQEGKLLKLDPNKGKLSEIVSYAKKSQQEIVDNVRDAGEMKEYIGVRLIPGIDKYDHVINSIEKNKGLTAENSSMNFIKGDGSGLEDSDQEAIRGSKFQPHSIVLMDGEPKIIGSFVKDEEAVEGLERIIAGGEEAESMARYLYGDKYELGLGVASINRMLPELMTGSSKVSLTPSMQKSIIGGYDVGETLNIEHKVTRTKHGENSKFVITDNEGRFVGDATNAYTIQGVLLSLITE